MAEGENKQAKYSELQDDICQKYGRDIIIAKMNRFNKSSENSELRILNYGYGLAEYICPIFPFMIPQNVEHIYLYRCNLFPYKLNECLILGKP